MINTVSRKRLRFTEEQLRQANSVSLLKLAGQYGYELEEKESRAYHAKHSGGLYFYKDNNVFQHFGSNKNGGAIAFVMMEENISFVDAVKQLLGASYTPMREAAPHTVHLSHEKKDLILPDKAVNFKRAYWYLVQVRGIDSRIVSALMNEKKVYQDTRGNCVFVGYDEQGGDVRLICWKMTFLSFTRLFPSSPGQHRNRIVQFGAAPWENTVF